MNVLPVKRIGTILLVTITCLWAQFDFPEFSIQSLSKLQLVGNATLEGKQLRLTNNARREVGAVWYYHKQNIANGFETQFTFKITDVARGGGDGLAFVIQNHDIAAIGQNGGAIGYAGIPKSVAIEFDTWPNYGDPNGNHLAVHTAGINANNSGRESQLGFATLPFPLDDGNPHIVKIVYRSHQLQIFVDSLDHPILTLSISIEDSLRLEDGTAWVGFTGATGSAYEKHYILNWQFAPENYPVTVKTNTKRKPSAALSINIFPNPFNANTTVNLSISKADYFDISIYNITGQKIYTLIKNQLLPGEYQLNWDGKDQFRNELPSGIYFLVIRTPQSVHVQRMHFVR